MKSLLALDLGTTSGFALRGTTGAIVSGTWSLKPGRFEGGGMRFVRFVQYLDALYGTSPFDAVFFEEVRRHKGTDAAHVYGGLMGQLTAWCETAGVPYQGVPVGEIKRFATSRGNADKDQVIEAVRSWGYRPIDSNEADALALLHLKMVEVGE